MLDCGASAATISRQLQIPDSSVRTMRERYKKIGHLETRSKGGRPRLTSARTDNLIARAVRNDRFISARQIKQDLGLVDVSEQTIRNRIFEMCGYSSYWSVHKPFINEENRKKRLDFAIKYINKPEEFWQHVLWSDESAYCYIMKSKERVWRNPHERFSTDCTIATAKHDKKIMVWGCFCTSGVGNLYWIRDTLDAKSYLNILNTQLLSSIYRLFPDRNVIFQQDNDPKHTAKVTKEWIRAHQIEILDWPPQSPDLNPIENLWNILDYRSKLRRPKSDEELFDILSRCWCAIDKNILQNLAYSMPHRLQSVIAADGWQTKY